MKLKIVKENIRNNTNLLCYPKLSSYFAGLFIFQSFLDIKKSVNKMNDNNINK